MTHSTDQLGTALRRHLADHAACSQWNERSRDSLVDWICSSGPFRDLEELRSELLKSKIKGLNKQQRQSFLDSLQLRVARRPFLTTLGVASLASLGLGLREREQDDAPVDDAADLQIRPLLAEIQKSRLSVGNAVAESLSTKSAARDFLANSQTKQFLHALDMSNWLEAAFYLGNPHWSAQLRASVRGTPISELVLALQRVLGAWEYLEATQSQWQDEYFMAYALGKMPALSTDNAAQAALPEYDTAAREHAETLHGLASLFHAMEIFNQRFQHSGRTKQGAPVRFTQGHNFSFAHLAEDLRDAERFDREQETVLVNWDAHADLGGPLENPRILLDGAFDLIRSASTFAERVVAASSMSIAGWILPLLQQGLMTSPAGIAKVIWVVPREAQQTSHNYMEPYGEYSFVVGEWQVPDSQEEIARQSTTTIGDWNIPGSQEIRKFGEPPMLRSVASRELLENQRECKLFIVDANELSQWEHLVADTQIALSVDVDYAGTREPGLTPRKGFLPHYPLTATAADRTRHRELLDQLGKFVDQRGEQIRSVSVANSPNFTVEEAARKPVARVLEHLLGDALETQPTWVAGEIARVAPTADSSSTALISQALTVGGISGIALTVGLLAKEQQRLRTLHQLLFARVE